MERSNVNNASSAKKYCLVLLMSTLISACATSTDWQRPGSREYAVSLKERVEKSAEESRIANNARMKEIRSTPLGQKLDKAVSDDVLLIELYDGTPVLFGR